MRNIIPFIFLFLLVFSQCSYAKLTDKERSHLRKLSMNYCSTRGGTFAIAFDKDKPLAKVFCRNGESKVFWTKDKL